MSPRAELKTARLSLRPVAPEDEGVVVAALNDLGVTGWLSVVPYPYTVGDFQHFLTEIAKPGETFAVLDAGGLAGVVGAGRELGYWFMPRAHGKGYATEAARAVMDAQLADDPADVVSGYFEGNARSANVLRKLGFVETGRGLRPCRALGIDRVHVDLRLTRDGFVSALPIEARSARLTYRSWAAVDGEALHDLTSDWEVVKQLGSWPWPPERDFAQSRATPYLGNGFAWAVLLAGRLIGGVAVTEGILGYSLAKGYWGQGFGLEAGVTALGRAFESPALQVVSASVWDDNGASLALLRKLGFSERRRTVELSKARQVETGSVELALSRADWFARPSA